MPATTDDVLGSDLVQGASGLTQTVLDNMGEGVALFDRHLRLRFINRQLVEFQNYPAELARIGSTLDEIKIALLNEAWRNFRRSATRAGTKTGPSRTLLLGVHSSKPIGPLIRA